MPQWNGLMLRIERWLYIALLSLLLVLLAGCGSTVRQGQSPTQSVHQIPVVSVNTPDVERQLQDILERLDNSSDEPKETQAIAALIALAEQHLAFGQCTHVHAILAPLYDTKFATKHTINEYSKPKSALHDTLANRDFLRASCAHPSDDIEKRLSLLTSPTDNRELQAKQRELSVALHLEALNYKAALSHYLQQDVTDVTTAWNITQRIPVNELADTGDARIDAYLSLSRILRQHGLDPEQLAYAITNWQFTYPQHPLLNAPILALPSLLQHQRFAPDTKIAVLLPLEGRLANSATQLKNGILAAYLASEDPYQLTFHNTEGVSMSTLSGTIEDADVVIGPLRKSQVTELQSYLRPEQVFIGLNRPSNTLDSAEQPIEQRAEQDISAPRFYFSLAPEDEAQQLAEHVFAQNYQQPIMIHAQDSTATRMADAFALRWQTLNPDARLKTLTFTNNQDMRDQITDALGVAVSQQRAKRLERFHGTEVFSVTRNRRDIDAFVVFADPEQTELINPMIEASLSTFSDDITPVYATSRSYNHKLNQNSLRDLQNVFFIDIPWLLDQQDDSLHQLHKGLYPDASTNELRLFAMGHDVYRLLFSLQKLQNSPNLHYLGMTGELSLTGNMIKRRLPQAQITQSAIRLVGQANVQ